MSYDHSRLTSACPGSSLLGQEATFSAFLRDEVVPDTRAQPGLIHCWTGESRDGDRDRQLRRLPRPPR
jgi:hypothetical protein